MMRTPRSSFIRLRIPPGVFLVLGLCAIALLLPAVARAQLITFSKQDLIDYTAQNPFDRLPDGRPKVPDDLMSGRAVSHPRKSGPSSSRKNSTISTPMDFMSCIREKPWSAALLRCSSCRCAPMSTAWRKTKAKASGLPRLRNQTAIDMLQPGDVLIVDLFDKKVSGTIVGDNLFYYVMTSHPWRRPGGRRQHSRP